MDNFSRASAGVELRQIVKTAVNRARNQWWAIDPKAYSSTWEPPVFRAQEIGYFDPDPDAKHVEFKETYRVYHNVFVFIDRLEAYMLITDDKTLRTHLASCLMGRANCWYTEEPSDMTITLIQGGNMAGWYAILE